MNPRYGEPEPDRPRFDLGEPIIPRPSERAGDAPEAEASSTAPEPRAWPPRQEPYQAAPHPSPHQSPHPSPHPSPYASTSRVVPQPQRRKNTAATWFKWSLLISLITFVAIGYGAGYMGMDPESGLSIAMSLGWMVATFTAVVSGIIALVTWMRRK